MFAWLFYSMYDFMGGGDDDPLFCCFFFFGHVKTCAPNLTGVSAFVSVYGVR